MRHLTPSALALVLITMVLASALPNPFGVIGRLHAQDRHVFEVQLQGESAFELQADRIVQHPSGMISLEKGDKTVAAFSAYQLIYLVRLTTNAEGSYEIKTNEGQVRQFPADDISFDPSNVIRLEAGGELVGIVWSNNVRYVAEAGALDCC